mgnify:CR=1 FL=1
MQKITLIIALIYIITLIIVINMVFQGRIRHDEGISMYMRSNVNTSMNISKAEYYVVELKINYTVINNPEMISKAKKFIKSCLPLLAPLSNKSSINWLEKDIAILRIIIKLVNNGNEVIYYRTSAWCNVLCNVTCKPFTWRWNVL